MWPFKKKEPLIPEGVMVESGQYNIEIILRNGVILVAYNCDDVDIDDLQYHMNSTIDHILQIGKVTIRSEEIVAFHYKPNGVMKILTEVDEDDAVQS